MQLKRSCMAVVVSSLIVAGLVGCGGTDPAVGDGTPKSHALPATPPAAAAPTAAPAPAPPAATSASGSNGSSGVDASVPPAPSAPSAPASTLPRLLPLHLMARNDTFDVILSLLPSEGAPTYQYMGDQYKVMATAPATWPSLPLYRCTRANGAHFQSNDAACEQEGTLESQLGYVYASDPGNGALRITRCHDPAGLSILSTLVPNDCTQSGRVIQSAGLGYAFPPHFVAP